MASATLSREQMRELICESIRRLSKGGQWPVELPATDRAARTIVTARDVEDAEGDRLELPGDAVVTPEAQDRARDLGITIARRDLSTTLNPDQLALADSLAAQLAETLGEPQLRDLAFWCWSEGTCADPGSVEKIVHAGADRVGLTSCAPPLADAIAPLIDHTLLKPEATEEQVRTLCGEAVELGFASVCVNPYYVPLVADCLSGSAVRTCTVVGFPLGANLPETKAAEARRAIDAGAQEVDMVVNLGALKSGRDDWVEFDIRQVVEASHPRALVKVILETALLDHDEIRRACEIARRAGADFVKTSTGFGPGGATVEHVALMRRTVGRAMGVKASGGIGTRAAAAEMILAGATRIGASAGVRIVHGE